MNKSNKSQNFNGLKNLTLHKHREIQYNSIQHTTEIDTEHNRKQQFTEVANVYAKVGLVYTIGQVYCGVGKLLTDIGKVYNDRIGIYWG